MSTPKPSPTITLTVNGEPREFFCSFALLNRVTFLVGAIENLAAISTDAAFREVILKEVLAERTIGGKVIKEVEDLGDFLMELEDVSELLNWISEHVLDFMLGVLEKSKALQFKHQARILKLRELSQSTQIGSQN